MLYLVVPQHERIYMILVYSKGQKENITETERKQIRYLAEALKALRNISHMHAGKVLGARMCWTRAMWKLPVHQYTTRSVSVIFGDPSIFHNEYLRIS